MRIIIGTLFVLLQSRAASALSPMDREHVESDQTVLVRGDRIVAVGATGQVPIPAGATVIDGAGHYLLPGLTDARPPRGVGGIPSGDAPLYLASGVTTVVNLRGTATFLEWKRRIRAGELVGPTIYTSGELLIGPRGPALFRDSGELVVGPNVATPDDAQRAIETQVRQGSI